MAPAGLTVAIVDRSLAGHELPITPVMYSYQRMIDKDSMYNTPPCWCIYILGLVLAWLERQGGVEGMQQLKHARAAKVYDFLDNSALFHPCAQPGSRSDMNVTFRTGDDALDKEFISGAAARPAESQGPPRCLAACAPRFITPCRWRAWTRSWII